MNILIIVDETPFYQPLFIHQLIQKLKLKGYKIYGANIIKIDKKNNIERYLISKFYKLSLYELLSFVVKKILYTLLNLLFPLGKNNQFFSIKSVFQKHNIPYFSVKKDINKNQYLNKIREMNLDLILNSSSLIFKNELLNLPKLGCLNRHTSLLPEYAGLWPVIQAIAKNEDYTGVSIHQMTNNIDYGNIYAQKKININKLKNVSLIYAIAFSMSSDLYIEAIEKIVNKLKPLEVNNKSSYYSFPTNTDWKDFRKNGGKFI